MIYTKFVKKPIYWFKAKKYGWGWYPCTWQGWAILAAYVAFTIYLFRDIDLNSENASRAFIGFVPEVVLSTLILIGICYKTGEKPRWRWGK